MPAEARGGRRDSSSHHTRAPGCAVVSPKKTRGLLSRKQFFHKTCYILQSPKEEKSCVIGNPKPRHSEGLTCTAFGPRSHTPSRQRGTSTRPACAGTSANTSTCSSSTAS